MINLHVLYADSDPAVRAMVQTTLERDRFFVARGCAAGDQALAAAIEWRPDLALLDVAMSQIDGPRVLARLRADMRTAPIPVVFMTVRAQASECARLERLGAAGVIVKPLHPTRLADTVRRYVPIEGILARARGNFLQRLNADAGALLACRPSLSQRKPQAALIRIRSIAHKLAGAGGIYGFAGISCESAALSAAAERNLAGCAGRFEVEHALDRLLKRIDPAAAHALAAAGG